MTKRQWFLVAGTFVLAGCGHGITEVCSTNEETGVFECSTQVSQPPAPPVPSVDVPNPDQDS